jgi:hypothetical protein
MDLVLQGTSTPYNNEQDYQTQIQVVCDQYSKINNASYELFTCTFDDDWSVNVTDIACEGKLPGHYHESIYQY